MSKNPVVPGFRMALEKSKSAGVTVEEAADELGMVHVVLGKEIARCLVPGSDGASALARIALVESKLLQAAVVLAEVHAALANLSAEIPDSTAPTGSRCAP